MSAEYPRCHTCGRQLYGWDLFTYRHARSISRDPKRCSRCHRKNEEKETK
jgi:DNA-directed RNA polymerase subunit RPC12/RpoP